MIAMMKAMTDRRRGVDGVPTSLLDLGYQYIGLDDGWQSCAAGVNGSFYDADGNPIVNTTKFPSMSGMVATGHALGLKVGWYANNCICKVAGFAPGFVDRMMAGTVKALRAAGFDAVKLDSCGQLLNLTRWNALLNASVGPRQNHPHDPCVPLHRRPLLRRRSADMCSVRRNGPQI